MKNAAQRGYRTALRIYIYDHRPLKFQRTTLIIGYFVDSYSHLQYIYEEMVTSISKSTVKYTPK